MQSNDIAGDITEIEGYLQGMFHVPVGVCIADTRDVMRHALGYEIADLRRERDPDCVTAFQYIARLEWAPLKGGHTYRLMYALYRREVSHRLGHACPVEEAERRLLLDMPIAVQRYAHQFLPQLVAAAGGQWQMLRSMLEN